MASGNPNEIDEITQDMDPEAKARYELYLSSTAETESTLIRVDVTASLMADWPAWQRSDFLTALPDNQTIKTIHLSGQGLEQVLTEYQIEDMLLNGLGSLKNLRELFIFQGGCPFLTETLLAKCLERAVNVKVLMLWQFKDMGNHPELAAAIRMHPSLERVTINLPIGLDWACFDVYAMCMAGMLNLIIL